MHFSRRLPAGDQRTETPAQGAGSRSSDPLRKSCVQQQFARATLDAGSVNRTKSLATACELMLLIGDTVPWGVVTGAKRRHFNALGWEAEAYRQFANHGACTGT